ncbi:MAG: hypothetical protein ACK47R_07820, partial [Planctomycetia bacterium]
MIFKSFIPFHHIFACTFPALAIVLVSPGIAGEEDISEKKRAEILKTFRDSPFLNKYCIECHGKNNRVKKGDVSFANALKRPGAGEFRKQWQATFVNVKEHSMPP